MGWDGTRVGKGDFLICRLTISWISEAEKLFLGKGSLVLPSVDPVKLCSTGQQRMEKEKKLLLKLFGNILKMENKIKIWIYDYWKISKASKATDTYSYDHNRLFVHSTFCRFAFNSIIAPNDITTRASSIHQIRIERWIIAPQTVRLSHPKR